jgi:hypothetical protein
MLVLITLLAVTSFKLSDANFQIVGNSQQRNQALSADQGAIEQLVSNVTFTSNPTNAIPNPCGGIANTTCVDVNGDGVTDVKVTVTPTCQSVQHIPAAALNFNNPDDRGCLIGAGQDFGIAGAATNNSLCANTLWDLQAVATDPISNAQYVVNQGTSVRVSTTTVCS